MDVVICICCKKEKALHEMYRNRKNNLSAHCSQCMLKMIKIKVKQRDLRRREFVRKFNGLFYE